MKILRLLIYFTIFTEVHADDEKIISQLVLFSSKDQNVILKDSKGEFKLSLMSYNDYWHGDIKPEFDAPRFFVKDKVYRLSDERKLVATNGDVLSASLKKFAKQSETSDMKYFLIVSLRFGVKKDQLLSFLRLCSSYTIPVMLVDSREISK